MKLFILLLACTTALVNSSPLLASEDEHEPEHDLIGNMGALQLFSHKLNLSIQHKNLELAEFYAHELEETLEDTIEIESYHDQPVGQMAEAMVLPSFELLEQALDAEPIVWSAVNQKFDGYIQSCNSCHLATGYGFIQIKRTDQNPFMQVFEPIP